MNSFAVAIWGPFEYMIWYLMIKSPNDSKPRDYVWSCQFRFGFQQAWGQGCCRTAWPIFRVTGKLHYCDVIMGVMASQINSLTIVYSTVYSGPDQRKHQSSASLAFVRGIHRWPVNSPHKWPVTRKIFPFDDVIMCNKILALSRLTIRRLTRCWNWPLLQI